MEVKLTKDEQNSLNSLMINDGQFALTTIDNPYDPFTQFYDWLLYDEEKGYSSINYLARIARTSSAFSDEENNEEIERAIDEIIQYDFMHIYKKAINKNYK